MTLRSRTPGSSPGTTAEVSAAGRSLRSSQLSQETELATARALVDRRLAGTASLPAQVRLRRLVGMLARKGYPAGLAYRVVREALDQDRQSGAGEALDGGDIDEDEFTNAELATGDPD